MKRLVSLAASSAAVLGMATTGMMATTAPAFASGGNNVCTNYKSLKLVECVGQINGNDIDIKISALNNNELNILSGNTLVVLAKDIDVIEATTGDVNVIAVDVSNVLNGLQVNVCNINVLNILTKIQANGSCHF